MSQQPASRYQVTNAYQNHKLIGNKSSGFCLYDSAPGGAMTGKAGAVALALSEGFPELGAKAKSIENE